MVDGAIEKLCLVAIIRPTEMINFLDPKKDSARIRAMYTHPDWTRKGVGSSGNEFGREAAKNLGFKKCELMATQSGILLYKTQGI